MITEWRLTVRSLYADSSPYGQQTGNRLYMCRASAVLGPTIYWRVYGKDRAQWEDLGSSSGEGFQITPTSFSTCVVQSVLVMDRTRRPASEGDVISCTASAGSVNASVYIRQGTVFHYITI